MGDRGSPDPDRRPAAAHRHRPSDRVLERFAARSTSSSMRSRAARPGRPPTRPSSSTCCARSASTWDAAHPRARGGEPDVDRDGPDLGHHRGDGRPRRGGPRAGLRARGRSGRPAVAPDRPDALRRRRADAGAGPAVRRPRPEHPGQVPGDTRRGSRRSRRRRPAGSTSTRRSASPCPQALAVAEAVERGLDAFAADGGDPASMTPVCTLMMGRLDDWLRVVVERDGIAVHPDALDWAGIAAFKRAYGLYRERGYRTRMLGAAYRHRLHWTELVGGDVVMTMPHAWQARFEASGITPTDRDRRAGRPGHRRRAGGAPPRLPARLRARRPDRSTSSTATARRSGPSARSSARTTTSSPRCATSSCPIRTWRRPSDFRRIPLRWNLTCDDLGPSSGQKASPASIGTWHVTSEGGAGRRAEFVTRHVPG